MENFELLKLRDNTLVCGLHKISDWSDHKAGRSMPEPHLTAKKMIRNIEENPGNSQNLKTGASRMTGGPGPCRKYPECPFMGEMPELEKIDI